jgi:N-acyl-D-amino-acid deacylase
MTNLLPTWALEGGVERLLARLRDPATRQRLREALSSPDEGWARLNGSLAWEDIVVASCQQQKMFEGQTVAQIATAMGQEPPEALLDFLLAEQGKVSIVVFMMSEDNVAMGLAHPQVMIGSDSLAMAAGRGGKPHPRTYGTFPRVLGKYVRQERIISLEDGIRKMTSMAAEKLGLADRGSLAEGKAADITIFDAATVQDTATFEAPHQYPEGIDYVIVNGQIVIEHGQQRPMLPGVVLRK